MTKPYSLAFKEKMLERLTGKDAVSAIQLGREMGVPQQTLSNWLQNARSIPLVAEKHVKTKSWVDQREGTSPRGSGFSLGGRSEHDVGAGGAHARSVGELAAGARG